MDGSDSERERMSPEHVLRRRWGSFDSGLENERPLQKPCPLLLLYQAAVGFQKHVLFVEGAFNQCSSRIVAISPVRYVFIKFPFRLKW
ncbi:hypothetical protein CEXT_618331 [Caerostris extrusa]|uniref:Uncharacterized protein n=1 Tax=Caerostris extrusa TaxID=172846 RepID=A0AAV4QCY1_CAEEX|nr:hypothetical protein CEXT_618331 [Caerostris extrusa]